VERDEREAIVESSKRVSAIAFGALGALALVFVVALIVVGQLDGGLSAQEAYARCVSTPPGLPEDVDVTNVQMHWSWLRPTGYVCVYDGPRGEETYPASADCLQSPGWCRKKP
jgi:hypothetical protein